MKKYIVTIIVLFVLIALSIGGYFVYSKTMTNKSNDGTTLRQKSISEIEFASSNLVEIMNEINNISYTKYEVVKEEISNPEADSNTTSENTINSSSLVENNNQGNGDVDWDTVKGDVEDIYTNWTTILIDLTTLNVNRDNLLKFNNKLDETINSIEKKDKAATLLNLAGLHDLLSQYLSEFSENGEKNTIYNIRTNVLYAYAYVESEDWNKIGEHIAKAKEVFSSLINNSLNNLNNIDIINKAYILVNELEEDSKAQNKTTFLISYRNLIEEMENIT